MKPGGLSLVGPGRQVIEFKCLILNLCLLIFLSVLQGKVWLIDFNPFGEVTDSLLFTWEELISERNLKGDFNEGNALEQVRQ